MSLFVNPIGGRAVTHLVADLVQGIEATEKGSLVRIKRHGDLPLRNRDTDAAVECIPLLKPAVQGLDDLERRQRDRNIPRARLVVGSSIFEAMSRTSLISDIENRTVVPKTPLRGPNRELHSREHLTPSEVRYATTSSLGHRQRLFAEPLTERLRILWLAKAVEVEAREFSAALQENKPPS